MTHVRAICICRGRCVSLSLECTQQLRSYPDTGALIRHIARREPDPPPRYELNRFKAFSRIRSAYVVGASSDPTATPVQTNSQYRSARKTSGEGTRTFR